jgi:hypothetical protein
MLLRPEQSRRLLFIGKKDSFSGGGGGGSEWKRRRKGRGKRLTFAKKREMGETKKRRIKMMKMERIMNGSPVWYVYILHGALRGFLNVSKLVSRCPRLAQGHLSFHSRYFFASQFRNFVHLFFPLFSPLSGKFSSLVNALDNFSPPLDIIPSQAATAKTTLQFLEQKRSTFPPFQT